MGVALKLKPPVQQLTCVTPKTTLAKNQQFLADSKVEENQGFHTLKFPK